MCIRDSSNTVQSPGIFRILALCTAFKIKDAFSGVLLALKAVTGKESAFLVPSKDCQRAVSLVAVSWMVYGNWKLEMDLKILEKFINRLLILYV